MEPKICPNCGRTLTENELYCYFCEMNLSELERKARASVQKAEIKIKNQQLK